MIQSKVVERAGSALEVGEKYGAGVGRSASFKSMLHNFSLHFFLCFITLEGVNILTGSTLQKANQTGEMSVLTNWNPLNIVYETAL